MLADALARAMSPRVPGDNGAASLRVAELAQAWAPIIAGERQAAQQVARLDAWSNLLTGLGSTRDPTTAVQWSGQLRAPYMQLVQMYNFDPLAKKICNIVPREMMREGYDVRCKDPQMADRCVQLAEDLNVDQALVDGMIWGRLFGGAVLRLGVEDGKSPSEPLDEGCVHSFTWTRVYDLRRAWPFAWYEQRGFPSYTRPRIFTLTDVNGSTEYVHESRLVVFRGAHTDADTRRSFNDWDLSVLDSLLDIVAGFWEGHASARVMLSEASVGVLTLQGLIEALGGGQAQAITDRLTLLDQSKSLVRSLVLDANGGESYQRVAMQLAGVSDILTQLVNIVAAATEIPVTLLMGQAPAGLNATGDNDMRSFYDRIASEQKRTLLPHLRKIFRLLGLARGYGPQRFDIEFRPLWQQTPLEQAQTRKTVAETDVLYLQNEVLTPEDVQGSRFGAAGWSPETTIQPLDPPPSAGSGNYLAPKAPAMPSGPSKPAPKGPPGAPAGPAKGS